MVFWLPISIPLGFLLDKILGKREGTYYSRLGFYKLDSNSLIYNRAKGTFAYAW